MSVRRVPKCSRRESSNTGIVGNSVLASEVDLKALKEVLLVEVDQMRWGNTPLGFSVYGDFGIWSNNQ
jgi:hypothetical protein